MQHLNPEISPALEGHPYFYQGATSSPIFCKLAWFGFCWRLEGRLESCKNLSCRNKSRTKTSHMIRQENTYQNWRQRIPYPAKICKQQDKTRRGKKYTWNSAILPASCFWQKRGQWILGNGMSCGNDPSGLLVRAKLAGHCTGDTDFPIFSVSGMTVNLHSTCTGADYPDLYQWWCISPLAVESGQSDWEVRSSRFPAVFARGGIPGNS